NRCKMADAGENAKKKKTVMCCPKDVKNPLSNRDRNPLPPIKKVNCELLEKLPKKPKVPEEPACHQSKHYQSAAEQRAQLEKEAVPIFMQGMLELAREMPKDPILHLEQLWLQKKHKCDIKLPENLL
ncbi:hypothetical protein KR044_008894, partial [Drosophila immigrans]